MVDGVSVPSNRPIDQFGEPAGQFVSSAIAPYIRDMHICLSCLMFEKYAATLREWLVDFVRSFAVSPSPSTARETDRRTSAHPHVPSSCYFSAPARQTANTSISRSTSNLRQGALSKDINISDNSSLDSGSSTVDGSFPSIYRVCLAHLLQYVRNDGDVLSFLPCSWKLAKLAPLINQDSLFQNGTKSVCADGPTIINMCKQHLE